MSLEDAICDDAAEEHYLIENGLLDPGQPTRQAHRRYKEAMEASFTPLERRMIRYLLGLGPGNRKDYE